MPNNFYYTTFNTQELKKAAHHKMRPLFQNFRFLLSLRDTTLTTTRHLPTRNVSIGHRSPHKIKLHTEWTDPHLSIMIIYNSIWTID